MRQVYNGLSVLLIALVAILLAAIAISENNFVQTPLQGGWNSYRYRELGIQITPYLLIFFSLLLTRLRKCPKWLFFAAMTLLLFFSLFVVIVCVKAALTLNEGAWITVLVFVSLLAAHLRFISNRGESSQRA